jgi:hypothetical protein
MIGRHDSFLIDCVVDVNNLLLKHSDQQIDITFHSQRTILLFNGNERLGFLVLNLVFGLYRFKSTPRYYFSKAYEGLGLEVGISDILLVKRGLEQGTTLSITEPEAKYYYWMNKRVPLIPINNLVVKNPDVELISDLEMALTYPPYLVHFKADCDVKTISVAFHIQSFLEKLFNESLSSDIVDKMIAIFLSFLVKTAKRIKIEPDNTIAIIEPSPHAEEELDNILNWTFRRGFPDDQIIIGLYLLTSLNAGKFGNIKQLLESGFTFNKFFFNLVIAFDSLFKKNCFTPFMLISRSAAIKNVA